MIQRSEVDAAELITRIESVPFSRWHARARIIVGSVRTVKDIQNADLAGAHIVTIPPQFLPKMVDHRYTRETVRQFVQDAEKTIEEMSKAASQGH